MTNQEDSPWLAIFDYKSKSTWYNEFIYLNNMGKILNKGNRKG
jgi:hypothetical protein